MLRRGSSILMYELEKQGKELNQILSWDSEYRKKCKIVLVPDFFFLLIFGRQRRNDIFFPFTAFTLLSGAFQFCLLEENFDEMYYYFTSGKSGVEKVIKHFPTNINKIREHQKIKSLLTAWNEYNNQNTPKPIKSILNLIETYRSFIQASEEDEVIQQVYIINKFDVEYKKPLKRIIQLVKNEKYFIRPEISEIPSRIDFEKSIYENAISILNKQRNIGKRLNNEIDAKLLAKCYFWDKHQTSNVKLFSFTDGIAYQAAMQSTRKGDWCAGNLKSSIISAALICENEAARTICEDAYSALHEAFENPKIVLVQQMNNARDFISQAMEKIWDYTWNCLIKEKGNDVETSLSSAAISLQQDFDGSNRPAEFAHIAGVEDTVRNIQMICRGSDNHRTYDFDKLLEPIYSTIAWIQEPNANWETKLISLKESLEDYTPEDLKNYDSKCLSSYNDIRNEIKKIADSNMLNEPYLNELLDSTKILDRHELKLLGEWAEEYEKILSINKKHLGAHVISVFIESIKNLQ